MGFLGLNKVHPCSSQGCVLGLLPLADKLKSLFSSWVCFTPGATTSCIQFQGELSSFLPENGWALPFLSPGQDSTCSCPSPGKDPFGSSLLLCSCPPSARHAPNDAHHLDEMELQMVEGMTGFQELLQILQRSLGIYISPTGL